MKTKEIEKIESLIKTENEYWNKYSISMLCETIQQGQFETLETPLQLFSNSIDLFTDISEHPFQAVQQFADELDKNKLTPVQKLFIYNWVCKFLQNSQFNEIDIKPIADLLNSQRERLKAETQSLPVLTKNIRETLKEMLQKELEQLPATLKDLEPVQRLNILCKLMPFVLPKVESVHHSQGEPV